MSFGRCGQAWGGAGELVVSAGSRDRSPVWHVEGKEIPSRVSLTHAQPHGGQSVSEPMQACIWFGLFVDSRSRDRNTTQRSVSWVIGECENTCRVTLVMPCSDTHLHLPVGARCEPGIDLGSLVGGEMLLLGRLMRDGEIVPRNVP